jgi:hypothetical protein
MTLPEAALSWPHHDDHTRTETRHRKRCGNQLFKRGSRLRSEIQTILAHLSTRDSSVACNSAKMILFFQSILQDVGHKQCDQFFF